MSALRILQINSSRGWSGGQYQVLLLCRGLRQRGHHVVLVCPPGAELASRAAAEGIPVEPVEMRGQWDLAAIARLVGILKRHRIELINSHKPLPHTLAWIAARLAATPALVATRRVSFPLRRHPFRTLKWSAGVAGLIAVARSVEQSLIDSGIPAGKVRTIYGAIDLERFSPRAPDQALRRELGFAPQHLVVGKVGDYRYWKGYGVFIEAAARVRAAEPRARFLAIGAESDDHANMIAKIRALDLEKAFTLTGFRRDVERFYSLMALSVNAATAGEGLPGVLRESLAMGVPVVATRVSGSPEVVADGENGLLVPPNDAAALAEAILKLLADPGLRQRMGEAGRRSVETRFSLPTMIDQTEAFYGECLARAHG